MLTDFAIGLDQFSVGNESLTAENERIDGHREKRACISMIVSFELSRSTFYKSLHFIINIIDFGT